LGWPQPMRVPESLGKCQLRSTEEAGFCIIHSNLPGSLRVPVAVALAVPDNRCGTGSARWLFQLECGH